jgi:copper chaperone CopZ
MRTTAAFSAAALLFAAGLLRASGPAAATAPNTTNRFNISGMHCTACARGIASELKRTPGVASAEVNFTNRVAVVAYDTNATTVKVLLKAVEEAGYEAELARH